MQVLSEERKITWGTERIFDTVIVKDDRLTYQESLLRRGTNKHSGKTWARFEDRYAVSYVLMSGRMRVFRLPVKLPRSRRTSQYRDETSYSVEKAFSTRFNFPSEVLEKGFVALTGKGHDEFLRSVYPMAQDFKAVDGLTPHLVARDLQELAIRVVGKKNYRKDVVKALYPKDAREESRTFIATMGMAVNGLVPIDWFVRWARAEDQIGRYISGYYSPHPKKIREALKTASQPQLRRLMFSDERDYQGLNDIVQGFHYARREDPEFRLDSLDFRSWRELERSITTAGQVLRKKVVGIEYTGKAKSLPGEYDGISIIAPKDSIQLSKWSGEMGNCISGYDRRAANQETLLYAVIEGGKMVANMELSPSTGNVRQLLGKFNKSIEPETKEKIGAAIHTVWPKAQLEGGWQ